MARRVNSDYFCMFFCFYFHVYITTIILHYIGNELHDHHVCHGYKFFLLTVRNCSIGNASAMMRAGDGQLASRATDCQSCRMRTQREEKKTAKKSKARKKKANPRLISLLSSLRVWTNL